MVLPAVAILLGILGLAAQYGIASVRAQHAASTAARIAIVDTDARALEVAQRIVGEDAAVEIVHDGVWIRVSVVDPGPWGLDASAMAVARDQD